MGFDLINKELTVSGIYLLSSLFVKRKNRLRSWVSGMGGGEKLQFRAGGVRHRVGFQGEKGRVVSGSFMGRATRRQPAGLPEKSVRARQIAHGSHASHPFPPPLRRLGLLFFLLNARFIVEASLLDLGEEAFFCQFSFKVLDGLFYLVVLHNNFHIIYLDSLINHPSLKTKKASLRCPGDASSSSDEAGLFSLENPQIRHPLAIRHGYLVCRKGLEASV